MTQVDERTDLETTAVAPCQMANKAKGLKCRRPATHNILLNCPTCQYNEMRQLCTRHAEHAKTRRWWCTICWSLINHIILPR